MSHLIAIHEIHRDGENGKTEVVKPGAVFQATEEEAAALVDVYGAARKPLEGELSNAKIASVAKSSKPLNVEELKAKLTELGVEFPADAKKADLQSLLDAKLAEDDLV